jgi:ubiquinone/menaquinone biosynthesis C-methylase UbiE
VSNLHEAGMNWVGLAAQVWDASGGDEPQWDHDFFKSVIERQGGAALDVGCGTGRLLLRYLAAGFDVDGIDTSADMLAQCRAKAARQGLTSNLHQQAMQTLDLPRRYRTIYIPCGTFCLILDRSLAFEALRRFYAHLEPEGLLVFNLFWVFGSGEPLSDNPLARDHDWNPMWEHSLPDGTKIAQHMRLLKLDRAEQVVIAERRYQRIANGQVTQEEIFPSNERWYFQHEMVMMLEKTGFRDVQVKGDYTGANFADGHSTMVFLARR